MMRMPPLSYIKRIPGRDYEALYLAYTNRPDRVGQFRRRHAHAVQPQSAGGPSTRGQGQ